MIADLFMAAQRKELELSLPPTYHERVRTLSLENCKGIQIVAVPEDNNYPGLSYMGRIVSEHYWDTDNFADEIRRHFLAAKRQFEKDLDGTIIMRERVSP